MLRPKSDGNVTVRWAADRTASTSPAIIPPLRSSFPLSGIDWPHAFMRAAMSTVPAMVPDTWKLCARSIVVRLWAMIVCGSVMGVLLGVALLPEHATMAAPTSNRPPTFRAREPRNKQHLQVSRPSRR